MGNTESPEKPFHDRDVTVELPRHNFLDLRDHKLTFAHPHCIEMVADFS